MKGVLPAVYIAREFPGNGIDRLKKHFDVTLNKSGRVLSHGALMKAVQGAEAIVSLLTDTIDAEVMDAAGPQLKLIANYAVGFDNVDLLAAKKRNIFVTNTPGVLTEAVAEHTFALMITVARQIVAADRFARHNKYKQWEPDIFLGMQLSGKTLGLIGLGRIGAGVTKMAQGFGMKTIYYDEIRHKDLEKKYNVEYHHLETVLKTADVVSLHVPLTPTTKHLIGSPELKLMKSNAIIINTARGAVIDEAALVHALIHKEIWGAGLDVFEHEPKIAHQLQKMDNVVLTPHIGSATAEARDMMSQIVADNVFAVFDTGKPLTPTS
jgi:glyoxylate reductase